jgi:hypothetical protein
MHTNSMLLRRSKRIEIERKEQVKSFVRMKNMKMEQSLNSHFLRGVVTGSNGIMVLIMSIDSYE